MLRPLERFGWQKKRVARVADYIEDHLDEEIPLQELAEVARLSRELRDQPYVLIPPRPPTLLS